ncbi:c-type cytochrome [Derxia lacustris]|uniref:c-type cytochrome n=1 Tax=Derxia lacustris TaxID=764842 RepID=UPI0038B25F45
MRPLSFTARPVAALALMLACALPGPARAADTPQGSADAGRQKNAACIGCHGIVDYKASFPEVYRVPRIGGQSAGYIAAALHAYKKGDRRHPTMRGVAQSLSDQDILDLAALYSEQK